MIDFLEHLLYQTHPVAVSEHVKQILFFRYWKLLKITENIFVVVC